MKIKKKKEDEILDLQENEFNPEEEKDMKNRKRLKAQKEYFACEHTSMICANKILYSIVLSHVSYYILHNVFIEQ